MSDSVRPHKRQPTRLPCPWDSPGKNTGVGCHFLLQCRKMKSECEVTLCDPMDCSLPGSSTHAIFQARILERMATSFKRSNACTAILSAPNPAASHHKPMPLLETPGHCRASLVSLFWGLCSFLLGPSAHKVVFKPSVQFSSVQSLSCV